MRVAAAPAGGELPVLALDVVDQGALGPGDRRRDDEAHALAGPGRREGHDVLGPVVPQVAIVEPAEEHALGPKPVGPVR